MKLYIDKEELRQRTSINFEHLRNDPYYGIGKVFSPAEYSWHGDKEGRALLAFVSHYKISGEKIPCMALMLEQMPGKVNSEGYFGPLYRGNIQEEQLSGHSWLLRGLCEHYQAFGDAFSLAAINDIARNLYLPLRGRIATYPILRNDRNKGGVSGEVAENIDGWVLSTDIGCAFMGIDGLSHTFEVTKDEDVKALLDEMISLFLSIDKYALKAQTHCTLTAARGMLRMYRNTGENRYLHGAESILNLYVHGGGMTKTYQNLNWWNRPDSWTEPCAIMDSLMVAAELYKFTGKEAYRTLAARIYHNGLSTSQRDNGGAGTDTLVCDGSPHQDLRPTMYEAEFCCSMRTAEGLWYISENQELLWAEYTGSVAKCSDNIYRDNDILYCLPDERLLPYAGNGKQVNGMTLYPIVKAYKVPRELWMSSKQKIVFD